MFSEKKKALDDNLFYELFPLRIPVINYELVRNKYIDYR